MKTVTVAIVARDRGQPLVKFEGQSICDYHQQERSAQRVLSPRPRTCPRKRRADRHHGLHARELYALRQPANHPIVTRSSLSPSSLRPRPRLRDQTCASSSWAGSVAALVRVDSATLGLHRPTPDTICVLDDDHGKTVAITVSAGINDFAGIAASCGYGVAAAHNSLGVIEALFAAEAHGRARLAQIKIRTGTREDLPRPALSPIRVLDRLVAHIGTAFS